MSTLVVLATADSQLANAWERQLPPGQTAIILGVQQFPGAAPAGFAAVVVLDAAAEALLPAALIRSPTIYVGEPRSSPFEQARLAGRARVYLSYEESTSRLRDLLPLFEELAEKQSMLDLRAEKSRRSEFPLSDGPSTLIATDTAQWWDFIEGAVENLDSRDRLVAEFRRASRHLLRASHSIFFVRDVDGFKADRGTFFFQLDDPIVKFFEAHPIVIDGSFWNVQGDLVAELAVRNRMALWGARLLAPIHDNGHLLGLVALGVRDDGRAYDAADRARAVYYARLLGQCLGKSAHMNRLSLLADHAAAGAKYFPNTLILAPKENAPRHVPVAVRDLIGRARRTRAIARLTPTESQPFRASAGLVAETGGIWAFWEEASAEVQDAVIRQRISRRGLLREIALTLSHELGNGLVSLAALRQFGANKPPPQQLLEAVRSDISRLEALNRQVGVMQTLDEAEASEVDIRDLAKDVGTALGVSVEVGANPVILLIAKSLVEFSLRSIIETIVENRPAQTTRELALHVRSSGEGAELTALLSIQGSHIELEGILPEPAEGSVPNQGRLGVFLAKEVLRLHHGEIHAGPGLEGTEILISLRSC